MVTTNCLQEGTVHDPEDLPHPGTNPGCILHLIQAGWVCHHDHICPAGRGHPGTEGIKDGGLVGAGQG